MAAKASVSLIRVLIADDHAIVRESLRNLLQLNDGFEVVGEAVDGNEAVNLTGALNPDVVLMDISMPGTDGIEATRQIRQLYPAVKVLALTVHDTGDYFFQMLSAGAAGYFVKGGSLAELVSAMKTVYRGEVFLYPTVARHLLNDCVQRAQISATKDTDGLTDRYREILKFLAEGKTNQEVAALLVLKPATVQWYRIRIMHTLGLRDHTALTKYALRHGIIAVDV